MAQNFPHLFLIGEILTVNPFQKLIERDRLLSHRMTHMNRVINHHTGNHHRNGESRRGSPLFQPCLTGEGHNARRMGRGHAAGGKQNAEIQLFFLPPADAGLDNLRDTPRRKRRDQYAADHMAPASRFHSAPKRNFQLIRYHFIKREHLLQSLPAKNRKDLKSGPGYDKIEKITGVKSMEQKPVRFGISTACLYPMETEKALELLGKNGVRRVELFINDLTELQPPLTDRFAEIRDRYQIEITALHSCFCPVDHFILFSDYDRRLATGREAYRLLYALARKLNAPCLVFHGDGGRKKTVPAAYARVLSMLNEDAAPYGVRVLQENVMRTKCGDPDYFSAVLRHLPPDISITFDAKQARRVGCPPAEFARRFLPRIAHVHISAGSPDRDCQLPSEKTEPLEPLMGVLAGAPRLNDIILEVYRDCYSRPEELLTACDAVQNAWRSAAGKELIPWNQTS